MTGRDREWAEYVQIMNLPISGVPRPDAQGAQANAMQQSSVPTYISGSGESEQGGYGEDEAHFVQSFVQSPQFLPYQIPGYFQHPGFTSQLYTDGRVFGQLYPFGAQQYMVASDNFQQEQLALQNNYPYKAQNNSGEGEEGERNGLAQVAGMQGIHQGMGPLPQGMIYANVHPISVTSMHDPPVEARPKPKKKAGPKSWADVANQPAAKTPVQRPKPQPQQILTKQTAKPEEKPGTKPAAPLPKKESVQQRTPAPNAVDSINNIQVDVNPQFARFFVIKSYSEDDIHKAIKYNIWASTDSGNRRLDTAWKESASKGPIYLFFSVNASGQFCGMAQMLSSLDYEKKCDLWAQDKWNGQFSVKWIFIKDIPNNHLRHIKLENNENKPVTNSRDTQEILLEPGKEMLRIFASFKAKSSILDDFTFYDKRQELMKEKKTQNGVEEQELDLPGATNRNRGRPVKKSP
jgi:hypothetical protein